MGKRRKARAIAIQLLYQLEMNKSDAEYALKEFWDNNPHANDIVDFTSHLVKGTIEHLDQIDGIIARTAKNWSFSRITTVDKGILREATFEFLFCTDIPYKVTMNEAIELGKKFGSEKSGTFINGILDNILNQNCEENP